MAGWTANWSMRAGRTSWRGGRRRSGWQRGAAIAGGTWLGLAAARALRGRFGLRLDGKVALLTGGSRGLGLAVAEGLAKAGARLAICSRNDEELGNACRTLAGYGAQALALRCDVTKRDQLERMVAETLGHYGRIDILVNDVGIIAAGPLLSLDLKDFEEVMAANFWGAVNTTQAVLPHMVERRAGRIVNITSIGGKVSVAHLLPYSCSKFALVGYSEGLRMELAKEGIVVVTVVPGLMRAGSCRNTIMKGDQPKEYAAFTLLDSLPLTSMSARRAARQIVAAMRRGDAEVVLSWQAQLAVRAHGLFPGLTADALALVARFLPGPRGSERVVGRGVGSPLTRSPLIALNQHAAKALKEAEALNEDVDQPPPPREGNGMDHDAPPTQVNISA